MANRPKKRGLKYEEKIRIKGTFDELLYEFVTPHNNHKEKKKTEKTKKKSKKNIFSLVELASMSLIALLFTLRVFYIRFPLVEWMFVAAVMVLFFRVSAKNA